MSLHEQSARETAHRPDPAAVTVTERVRGSDLKVGDVLHIWGRGADQILAMSDYTGPLACLWPEGARIATFAVNRRGMTIEPQSFYDRVVVQVGELA